MFSRDRVRILKHIEKAKEKHISGKLTFRAKVLRRSDFVIKPKYYQFSSRLAFTRVLSSQDDSIRSMFLLYYFKLSAGIGFLHC